MPTMSSEPNPFTMAFLPTSYAMGLRERLDENFSRAIEILLHAPGKVIVTGVGKSGLIGRKIAATFASTGTPAFFLHPVEGMHGDIGMGPKGDVVIALSHSGETEEIVRILPLFKRLGLSPTPR